MALPTALAVVMFVGAAAHAAANGGFLPTLALGGAAGFEYNRYAHPFDVDVPYRGSPDAVADVFASLHLPAVGLPVAAVAFPLGASIGRGRRRLAERHRHPRWRGATKELPGRGTERRLPQRSGPAAVGTTEEAGAVDRLPVAVRARGRPRAGRGLGPVEDAPRRGGRQREALVVAGVREGLGFAVGFGAGLVGRRFGRWGFEFR